MNYSQDNKEMDGIIMETKYSIFNSGHSDSLQVGMEFQDFVCIELAKRNWIIQNLNSKLYQYNFGENLQKSEIKYDARCTGDRNTVRTNRLSIEIAEKVRAENDYFIDSGIYRKSDNSIFYIQGNYMQFWIFATKHLRLLHKSGRYAEHSLPTLKGFFLPIEDANKWSIELIIPNL